jgi:hypothetical protein
MPVVQTSFLVQLSPSLHPVPSCFSPNRQPPLPLQAEPLWHWLGVQV